MIYQRAALVAFAALAVLVTACSGGSSAPPVVSTGTVSPPAPSSSSSAVVPTSGGSVSTTLGGATYTVTVPSGGLSKSTTITITAYAPGKGPHGVSSAKRSPQTYTTGTDTLIADVVIDAGGATVLLPLQLSVSNEPAPASGNNAYVEGYNNGSFDDVATASFSGTTYTTAANAAFPGLTLAANTEYVLYTHAGTFAGDGTIALNAPATAVPTGSQVTITPTETTANGFPYLGRTFTFTNSNPGAGTINPTSGTSTTFTAGPTGGTTTIGATDTAVTSRTASAALTASSSRPGASGFTAAYTGSVTENDQNNLISATPVPNVSTYSVAASVSTSNDSNGNTVFTSTEADNGGTKSVNTTTNATVAYQTSGNATNVRTLKTVATDSNGVTYETDYGPNNGLTTVLPEANGTFSNDAQLEYKENDPGISAVAPASPPAGCAATVVSIDRCQNSNGSYVQYNGALTSGAAVVDNVATGNADFSGELDLFSIVNGRKFIFQAPSGGTISYQYYNPFNTPSSAGCLTANTKPCTVPNWIPASLTQPSVETDTITTGATLDASCAPAAKYGTTATKVTQTITTADPVFGTLETRVTSSYDVAGPGTICTVVSDTIQTFYDYSVQEGPAPRLRPSNSATVPAEQITIAETLSLQSSNAPGAQSAARSVSSLSPGIVVPKSLMLARVEHLAHQRALQVLSKQFSSGGSSL